MAGSPKRTIVGGKGTVVAIDSNFDVETRRPFLYRQARVYPRFERKGFHVVRCQGKRARCRYAAPEARKPGVVYLTGVGHGMTAAYLGDQRKPVFAVGHYQPQEADEKVVHFLSCNTAACLGRDFVSHGCRAYLGYDGCFMLVPAHYEDFAACDAKIDWVFAGGGTADQAFQEATAKYNRRIARLLAQGKIYTAQTLAADRDLLRGPLSGAAWGDGAARLY